MTHPIRGGDEQLKFYLTVKYKMFMSRLNELLRRYWAAYVVLLVMILYMGYVPNSSSKTEGLIVVIVLSLIGLALFIRGTFKRACKNENKERGINPSDTLTTYAGEDLLYRTIIQEDENERRSPQ